MALVDKLTVASSWLVPQLRHGVLPLRGPLLVALAYFLGAEAAFFIGTLSDKIFALFWPPNVILFCALLVVPQRQWWAYLAAVLPAHVIAELGVGMPLPQMAVAFATNCMVALLNAYVVRRLVGEPPWFGTLRKAVLYIAITAGPCPALSAFGGAFVPILGGGPADDYWTFWLHWYLANALPNLTIGPVFLIWFSDGAKWSRWALSRRQVEPALLALGLVGTCVLIGIAAGNLVSQNHMAALLLVPLPLVLWTAIRFGEKGASAAILIVTVMFTWRTLRDPPLFAGHDPERNVLALQLFLMALTVPVLLLGAVIDELRRTERLTRRLAASLMTAQDDERRRIARDLHDSTGQNLIAGTLITGQLQKIIGSSAAHLLLQLDGVLQQSIREIRTVSYLLHPPLLDEAGLGLALREYVKGYAERSGIKVDLIIDPRNDRLLPDVELVLFRIVQEALSNVARHSGSPTATITLQRRRAGPRPEVALTIEDAGGGIRRSSAAPSRAPAPGSALSGVGLASMRERIEQIGGRLDVESRPGGTTIRAVAPATPLDRPDRTQL